VKTIEATRRKISAFLRKVRALQAGDFAQPDALDALAEIEAVFVDLLASIESLERDSAADANAVSTLCNAVLDQLFTYLPILGFIHRSKSASNPYELYGPLLRLAKKVIGPDTKLVISSEWNFSPYTFFQMRELPSYALVGLPASESENALLAPLAGHEFGHSIWVLQNAKDSFEKRLTDLIVYEIRKRWKEYSDFFPGADDTKLLEPQERQNWRNAHRWTERQVEEVFCDLLGLKVFMEAYLHAFAFLLAPGMEASRVPYYSSAAQRIQYMLQAANKFGAIPPADLASLFEPAAAAEPTREGYLRAISDAATAALVPELIDYVEQYVASRGLAPLDRAAVAKIVSSIEKLVPDTQSAGLAELLNAGWVARQNPLLWSSVTQIANRRDEVLNELLLKAAEVLELDERIGRTK
jgi:hypothetical protein